MLKKYNGLNIIAVVCKYIYYTRVSYYSPVRIILDIIALTLYDIFDYI